MYDLERWREIYHSLWIGAGLPGSVLGRKQWVDGGHFYAFSTSLKQSMNGALQYWAPTHLQLGVKPEGPSPEILS